MAEVNTMSSMDGIAAESGPCVCIVDGSSDDRAETRRLFLTGAERQYRFTEAATGAAGVQMILAHPPDCLLLSCNLPDLDALGVLAALADSFGFVICPVVVLTGAPGLATGQAMLRLGAHEYIDKDWLNAETLARAVDNATERWALARELRERSEEMRASVTMLQLFVQKAPFAVAQFDREMRYLFASERWQQDYGLTGDVAGRSHYDLFPEMPEAWKAAHRRTLAGETMRSDGDRFERADGSVQWIRWEALPWRHATGKIGGILITAEDITARKLIEESLREKANFLERIAQVTPGVLSVHDLGEARSAFINRTFESLLGYSTQDVQAIGSRSAPTLMHPEDLPRFEAHLAGVGALLDGEVAAFEFRMRDLSGEWHWFHSHDAVFARDAAGAARQLIGVASEITERKRVEQDLRNSNEFVRLSQEYGRIGTWDWDLVTNRLRWSEMQCRQFGVDVALKDQVSFESWRAAVHPDDLFLAEARIQNVVNAGHESDIEYRIVTPDGIRWMNGRGVVHRDATGNAVRMTGVDIDVTERKQAERETRASEERLRAFVTASSDVMYRMSADWSEMRELDGRNFLVDTNEPRHNWLQEYIFEDDRPNVLKIINEAIDAKTVFRLEHRVRRVDGSAGWTVSRAVPLLDAQGEILEWFGAASDITDRKRAEDAVARLAAIVESSHDGIVSADLHGIITTWNHGAESVFGYSAEEMVGHSMFRVIPPARHDAESDILARVGRGEDVRPFETVRLRSDGSTVDVSVSVSPVEDALGTIVGISTVARDISERRRGEDALRENAALFSTLIAQAPMGTYVLDEQFRMRQINAEALPAFGTITSLIGRDFEEVVEILWGPEVGAQIATIFRHTLDTGERYVSPPFTEWRHDIGMAQSYEWETQRVTLPDGQHGVVCYFHEVTERALATEALRASAQRMSLATEATGVAVWEWNISTNRIRWDAEMFRMYGITPTPEGDVDYAVWSGAVLPEDLSDNEAILADTVRQCGRSARTFRIRRRNDGACRYIAAVETVRTNAEGKAEWVVGTNLDVTEQKRVEAELRRLATELSEADLRKDEFLATLAHELRNPLAPIRNGVEIMRLSNGSGPPFEAALAMIERQSRQMVHLVDDLLDVSRITRGKLELRKQRIDLAAVLESAVETSRPLVEAGGHTLTVLLPREPLFVDADMTRLAQIFANLLNNAAKYSERGGHIRVTAEPQAGDVVVRVQDSGIGIAPEMLPKIFEMFMQVDRSLDRSQGGLGIGLGLAKRLAELHGGSMEARSDGIGRGSEFVVCLPMVTPHEQVVEAPVAAGVRAATSGGRRILVADDNADAADSLTALLEILGHEVRTVGDGVAAVALAGAFRPHVIVLDIGMPKLDGYEACRSIRKETWGKDVVLIALSGWGQDEDRRRSREAGFDHHIAKPVDLTILERLLGSLPIAG